MIRMGGSRRLRFISLYSQSRPLASSTTTSPQTSLGATSGTGRCLAAADALAQGRCWTEAHRLGGRDLDLLLGTRIGGLAGGALTHVERAQAAELHALALAQPFAQHLEERLHRLLRLGLAQTGSLRHIVDDLSCTHRLCHALLL